MLITDNVSSAGTASLVEEAFAGDTGYYAINSMNAATYDCSSSGVISSITTPSFNAYLFEGLNVFGSGNRYNMFRIYKYMKAGAYDFQIYTAKSSNRGIISLYIDDTNIGSVDMYNATTAQTMMAITNFSVSTSKIHKIELRADAQNASSTGYYNAWTYIHLYPHV
jgi:hypothetical protein